MVDPAALREALAEFNWIEPDEELIVAAARELLRLMETAETVGWCIEHKASWVPASDEDGADLEDSCLYWYWLTDTNQSVINPCRMVEAVLTRREPEPVETELDRNQMGIW